MDVLKSSAIMQILLFALSAATEPNENLFRTRRSLTLDLLSPLQRNENRPQSSDIVLDILSSQTAHERKRRGVKFFAPPNYPPPKNLWRPSKRPRKLKHITDTHEDFHLSIKDPDNIHNLFEDDHISKDFGPVIHLEDDFESLNEIIDYADEVSSDHTLFDVHDFVPSHPPNDHKKTFFDNDDKKTFFESNEFHHDDSDEHFPGHENSNFPGTSFFSDEVHHESKPDNHIPGIHSMTYTTDSFGEIHSSPHQSSHEKIKSGFHHSSHGEAPLNFHSDSHEDDQLGHKPTATSYTNSNGDSHLSHVMNNQLYRADVPTKVVTNENDRVTEGGDMTHLTPGGIKGLKPKDYRFISEKTKPYVLGQAQY